MTEPVAYLAKSRKSGAVNATVNQWSYHDFENIPLYTKEQLQPKVQMTQAEFNEWKEIYNYLIAFSVPVHEMLDQILENKGEESGRYIELAKRVYQDDDFMSISKKQAELANLFVNYSPDNPEETIDIVPNKKWFVRAKEKEHDLYMLLSDLTTLRDPWFYTKNDRGSSFAHQFYTKEEAEKWTNPLTEAVQLPVEGE